MTRTDFEAVNARNVTIRTFGDLESARRWVCEHASEHDGLHVDEVITQVIRRRVYRPAIRLVTDTTTQLRSAR